MVLVRLDLAPSGVSDGPWAYMGKLGIGFLGNRAEFELQDSTELQEIQLTFSGNTLAAKVDYELYLDDKFKKKGTAKIYHGTVGSLTIRFFLKAPKL